MAAQPKGKRTKEQSSGGKAQTAAKTRRNADDNVMVKKTNGITPKQKLFVSEYLLDLNGTQAYLRAFPGTKENSARTLAARMLANVSVQDEIAKGREETTKRLELSRDDVIAQYRRLGFSDPRKLYDAYGQIKSIQELDDDTAAAVQSIEVEQRMLDGPDAPPVAVLKVRMADRKAALDSIMKAQGWNMPDKMEHTGKNGGPIEHAVRVVLVPPKQKADVTVKPIKKSDEG